MKKETETFIKNIVKKITNEYNVKYPIDIDELIKKFGGNTVKGLSLGIIKNDNKFTIVSDDTNYQKALMLGFLILHLRFKTNNDAWKNLENKKYVYKTDMQFEQIKEFAYDLLLPDDLFFKELSKVLDDNKQAKAEDVAEIGKKFKVSPTLIFSKAKDYIY